MKGVWVRGPNRCSTLRTADGLRHAHVQHHGDSGRYGSRQPWCVWSPHLEGNDYFPTEREAKLHARKRLRALLKATEALR